MRQIYAPMFFYNADFIIKNMFLLIKKCLLFYLGYFDVVVVVVEKNISVRYFFGRLYIKVVHLDFKLASPNIGLC